MTHAQVSAGLVLLVPLLPLLAAGTLMVSGALGARGNGRGVALTAAVLSLSCVALRGFVVGTGDAPVVVHVAPWLGLPTATEHVLGLSLLWDRLSELWLLTTGLAAVVVLWKGRTDLHSVARGGSRRGAVLGLLLLTATQMLLLAADLLQTFLFWQLSWILSWLIVDPFDEDEASGRRARRTLLTGVAADFPLLFVVLAAWDAFGSLEFETLFAPASLAAVRAANPALVGMLGYGIVLSALFRMAQFPLGTWVLGAASGGSWAAGWVSGLVLPAAAFVIVRSLPALVTEPATLSLLLGVGGLSAVLWGVVCIAQHDLRQATLAFLAGTCGLLVMGIGTVALSGTPPVLFLAVNLTLLAVAFVTVGWRDSGVSSFAARSGALPAESGVEHQVPTVTLLLALAGGLWGQEAVVSGIWDASRPTAAAADEAVVAASGPAGDGEHGPAARRPLVVLPLVAAAAHLLLCFGLFRAWVSGRMGASPAVRSTGDSERGDWGAGVVVALALLAGPLLCLLSPRLFGAPARMTVSGALTLLLVLGAPGLTALLALLALLSAWLLYGQPSPLTARLEGSVSSLSRLGRRRFYVDEAVEGVFAWPVRALSVLALWIDRRLLPSLVVGVPERLSRGLARCLASLEDGSRAFHGLTVFLVTAVIVLCLVSG